MAPSIEKVTQSGTVTGNVERSYFLTKRSFDLFFLISVT